MSKSPLGPSLQDSNDKQRTVWTTENQIDKQTQFIAMHSIVSSLRAGREGIRCKESVPRKV